MYQALQNTLWAALCLCLPGKSQTAGGQLGDFKEIWCRQQQTVLEMAQGARQAFNSDIGLSVSCIAGPGGAATDKPVGTSWCGLSTGGQPGSIFSW